MLKCSCSISAFPIKTPRMQTVAPHAIKNAPDESKEKPKEERMMEINDKTDRTISRTPNAARIFPAINSL